MVRKTHVKKQLQTLLEYATTNGSKKGWTKSIQFAAEAVYEYAGPIYKNATEKARVLLAKKGYSLEDASELVIDGEVHDIMWPIWDMGMLAWDPDKTPLGWSATPLCRSPKSAYRWSSYWYSVSRTVQFHTKNSNQVAVVSIHGFTEATSDFLNITWIFNTATLYGIEDMDLYDSRHTDLFGRPIICAYRKFVVLPDNLGGITPFSEYIKHIE